MKNKKIPDIIKAIVFVLIFTITLFMAIKLPADNRLSFFITWAKKLLPVGVAACIVVSLNETNRKNTDQFNRSTEANNKTYDLNESVRKKDDLGEREKRLKEAFEADLKELKEKGIGPIYQIVATEIYWNVFNGLKQDGQVAGDQVLWCISILTGIACQHSAVHSPIYPDDTIFFTETKSKELFMFGDSITYYLLTSWNMAAGTYHKLFPDRPLALLENIQSNVAKNIGKDEYKVWNNSTNQETVKEFWRVWEKQYDNILLKMKIPAKKFALVYSVALCIALEKTASVFPEEKDPFSMAFETVVYSSHYHEPSAYDHNKTEKLRELGLL